MSNIEQNLIQQFGQAGFELQIAELPIHDIPDRVQKATYEIVQLGIGERELENGRRVEYFRLYLGLKENQIEVIDVDIKQHLLLLKVKQQAREIIDRSWVPARRCKMTFSQIISDKPYYFLLRMLDGFAFWTLLPDSKDLVKSVNIALDLLKPEEVKVAEIKSNVIIHGDWFFIAMDSKKDIQLNKDFPNPSNYYIGLWGNERYSIEFSVRDNDGGMYAKGWINHQFIPPLYLASWYKVVSNLGEKEKYLPGCYNPRPIFHPPVLHTNPNNKNGV